MLKILVHLDALMDYRLAAVGLLSDTAVLKAASTYQTRLYDDFDYPELKQEDWEAQVARPQELIEYAMGTAMSIYLRLRCDGIIKDEPHREVEYTINTYPVNISDDAKKDVTDILSETLGAPVVLRYIPYHNYTSIISDFTLLVGYSLDWTSELGDWLSNNPQPELLVYTARVLKHAVKERQENPNKVFPTLEFAYRPTFQLNFLPIQFFNALTPDSLNEIIGFMEEDKD